MIREQLVARGIEDTRVLEAFREVPRHLFVREKDLPQAYEDHPIPIGEGQTTSQTYMVAAMLELLELEVNEKVLEIGTGSGYESALLSRLAREVYTIERLRTLYESAQDKLKKMGYVNIHFKWGDGSLGWSDKSPFQAIVIGAAAPQIPPVLMNQLDEGGRLVLPVGDRKEQILTRVTRGGDDFKIEKFMTCIFVPLIGEEGWKE
ncbi:MAG: protein-L-isoaspartate(D-aspartate) O-methyltransferase [Chlamydiae bacterium]|nr:protein-L-isoaspartate(D-aspartate) O-methyltransferase [Chlamydiota bacterium]MBI3266720.1 protein-L-isoaspartate(D-aspartate) O-methyltransferase [Chlamydiota bacterium]